MNDTPKKQTKICFGKVIAIHGPLVRTDFEIPPAELKPTSRDEFPVVPSEEDRNAEFYRELSAMIQAANVQLGDLLENCRRRVRESRQLPSQRQTHEDRVM